MRQLTRAEQTAWNDLQWHWDTAYAFRLDATEFVAVRAWEPTKVLSAETPDALRQLVRDDYSCHKPL